MKITTSISSLFRGIHVKEKHVRDIIGSPITYEEKTIGAITDVDLLNDIVYMEIDTQYATELFESYPHCTFTIHTTIQKDLTSTN